MPKACRSPPSISSSFALKIIRVGDRLLSQIESGMVDQTTLYSWKDSELENSQGTVVWKGTMDVATSSRTTPSSR